jgi:O-antigen/teichoic acid export membrane protein
MAFQEVTVAVITNRESYLRARRFIVTVGLALTLLTLLIVLTPLITAYLAHVVGLPPVLRSHVVQAMQVMMMLPMLMALRNLYRGALIRRRFTNPIQLAMLANAVVLVVMLGVGVRALWTGVMVATVATVAAQVAEVTVLYVFFRKAFGNMARSHEGR